MTETEDRHRVYRAIDAHNREIPEGDWTGAATQVEIAVQLRHIATHLEVLSESRISVAVSLDRIAAALEKAFPPSKIEKKQD